jgi:hypothetical protein
MVRNSMIIGHSMGLCTFKYLSILNCMSMYLANISDTLCLSLQSWPLRASWSRTFSQRQFGIQRAICLPSAHAPSVGIFYTADFDSSLSFCVILKSFTTVCHSFRIHELLAHNRYPEWKVRAHEMRTPPLLFSVFLILFTFTFGIPHRSTIWRRADAAAAGGLAAEEVFTGNAAEAADATDAADRAAEEQQPRRLDAGPLPPDLFADPARRAVLEKRTEQVKQAFLHSWNSYNKISLGQSGDELKPKSGKVDNTR